MTTSSVTGTDLRTAGESKEPSHGLPVECTALGKTFVDGTTALHHVDLLCPAGQITVLLGPSGCGKTTLLRCVAGLESPSAGTIMIGESPARFGGVLRRDVAMVFQNYALYPNKNVSQNIEFPLRMSKVPRAVRQERVDAVAELLTIQPLLRRRVNQLSGGQRQRVGIGRAIVREPSVLLMDEPLSNLDAALRLRMRTELHRLQRQLGTTMVFVTHDQAEALALADLLVVMNDGRIEQAAGAEEVFSLPSTKFVAGFLGGMNLIDGAADRAGFRLSDSADLLRADGFVLPPTVATIGVRPEDWRPGPGGPGTISVKGSVLATELLGRERLLHFGVGGHTVRAKVHVGDPVASTYSGHVARADIHLFDAGGSRIAGYVE